MKTQWVVQLRSNKELTSSMKYHIIHNTRFLKFNPKRKELVLWDLHKETIYRIFGCEEELVKRFYPSYHTFKYDLESLRIENKAEAYEFWIEGKH